MPPKLGDNSNGAAPQNAGGAVANSNNAGRPAAPAQQDQPPARQSPQPPRAQGRDDDPVEGPPDDGGGGGGSSRKRWDEYSNLSAGTYTFLACVNQVVRWEKGVSQTLKVLAPGDDEHDGRQVEWQQSPPSGMSDKFLEFWRRRFFGAYAAGGWTVSPNETGWAGWQPSDRMGANGQPLPLPPYDRYFVVHADGLWIPTVLSVEVEVDDPPYDKFPKVTSVRPLVVDGRRVQAPMPWRVIDWIAEQLGWNGVTERVNKATKPLVKLDYKQIEQGAGGLMWWRDAIRRIGDAQGKPYRPTVKLRGQQASAAGTTDIPF